VGDSLLVEREHVERARPGAHQRQHGVVLGPRRERRERMPRGVRIVRGHGLAIDPPPHALEEAAVVADAVAERALARRVLVAIEGVVAQASLAHLVALAAAHRPPRTVTRRRPLSGALGSLSRRATSSRPMRTTPAS